MSQIPSQVISCPDCGKRYPWQPRLVGRRVVCKCGSTFQVPDATPLAPGDEYDVAEAPPPPPPPPPPVLTYESNEVIKENRRRILEEWHIKDLWLPISLVALGAACKLLLPLTHSTGGGVRAALVMGIVALCTAFNVLVMLAAVMISARLVELDINHPLQAVVKLGLLFVIAASVGGLIANFGRWDATAVTVGVHAVIVIYWVLFSLLFKANFVETMLTVAIMLILQGILNVGLWKA